jgi:hypothetical protein
MVISSGWDQLECGGPGFGNTSSEELNGLLSGLSRLTTTSGLVAASPLASQLPHPHPQRPIMWLAVSPMSTLDWT